MSLIKVAIYEIYGMKWGARPLNLPLGGGMVPLVPPRDACEFEHLVATYTGNWYQGV